VNRKVIFFAIFIFLLVGPLIPTYMMIEANSRPTNPNPGGVLIGTYVLGFLLIPLALGLVAAMAGSIMWFMRLICGPAPKQTQNTIESESDDIELIKDIHRGLSGMEKRVESLETLMMDRMGAPMSDSYKE
jgi:hypothetical protein